MLLGVGAKKSSVFVDDVISTQVYTGTGSAKTITNSIKLADGGLVITKNRDSSSDWAWGSPIAALGTGKYNRPNNFHATATDANSYTAFNNNGYTIGSSSVLNNNGDDFVSYSFKKTPGLIDVISYVGNDASSRVLSHDLGSVPGWIVIICTTKSESNTSWHRNFGERVSGSVSEYYAFIGSNVAARNTSAAYPALPTATELTIGSYININNETYVAYIFAGGESTNSLAKSVSFDSNGEYLSIGDSSDFDFGSTFTFEAWVKPDFSSNDYYQKFYEQGTFQISIDKFGRFIFDLQHNFVGGDTQSSSGSVPEGQWTHVAAVCTSGVLKLYVNGVHNQNTARTGVNVTGVSGDVKIGRPSNNGRFTGNISNLRIVKGTAVYTSSFSPPTEPLTNITNTKLLCCNDSSTTGSTVTPNTITANGSPTASTDSPFDDPAGFVFGDAEDQNVIKCGSYIGNGTDPGPEIFLGWEPSWIMLKRADSSGDWAVFDSMRGIVTGGSDKFLRPNLSNDAATAGQTIELTPTGFKLRYGQTISNLSNAEMIYVAIRRSDGYVGKPPELGSDVFTTVVRSSSTAPRYISNFPVDWALNRSPSLNRDWFTTNRLTGPQVLKLNSTDEGNDNSDYAHFDHNNGYSNHGASGDQSWMWKRHKGFEVQAYKGVSGNGIRAHQMSTTPEMIWVKNRDQTDGWAVFHKDLGTYPQDKYMRLDTQSDIISSNQWYLPPTSTHWYTASGGLTNVNGENYIAMLFASTDVSAVGSYAGQLSDKTVTVGFQPRFIIIKRDSVAHWVVFDTLRGISSSGSGGDYLIYLNSDAAQSVGTYIDVSSTGFTVKGNTWNSINTVDSNYLYYAHA